MVYLEIILGFLINVVSSGIIIYLATKLLGDNKKFGTAILCALPGAILFILISYFLGISWIATSISSIAWLIAISILYNIGFVKSLLITLIIGVFGTIVNIVLLMINRSFVINR